VKVLLYQKNIIRRGGEDPIIGLGGEASAAWLADGVFPLNDAVSNQAVTVHLRGREKEALSIRIHLDAFIGSIPLELPEIETVIYAKSEQDVPIDVRPLVNRHESQFAYPTMIHGVVIAWAKDDQIRYTQLLDPRYLVQSKDEERAVVYDDCSFYASYPQGVTDVEELQRITDSIPSEILAEQGGVFFSPAHLEYASEPGEILNANEF
jgi:hypothetical protein